MLQFDTKYMKIKPFQIFFIAPVIFSQLNSSLLPQNTHFITPKEEFCEQHTQICPVDEATWQGENNGWQFVGRRWHAITYTPSAQQVIWEWSRPYTGSTPNYKGYREDHYSDFSDAPEIYPKPDDVVTRAYEYEIWRPENDRMVQIRYAGKNEQETHTVGTTDCENGLVYPVTTQVRTNTVTAMSVMIDDKCAKDGYAIALLDELWGRPNTPERSALCDAPLKGVPASESSIANNICKTSPYVAVVYQGYAWSARKNEPAKHTLGCETVLYAWGWSKPSGPADGGKYMEWNRNGMLRFSHWQGFWDIDSMPKATDTSWWLDHCKRGWTESGSVIYSGQYVIGNNLYTDTILDPTLNQKTFLPLSIKY